MNPMNQVDPEKMVGKIFSPSQYWYWSAIGRWQNIFSDFFGLGLVVFLLVLITPGLSFARGGGGCLEEGTAVWTPKGLRPIEKLERGALVWGLDSGNWRKLTVQAVTRVQPEEYLEITAGGGRVRITPEHPVMVAPGVYRQAGRLVPGETVFRIRRGRPAAVPVQSVQRLVPRQPAYNLLVSPGGTFVAGNLVLHNKGCFLPDSPILRSDGAEVTIRLR